MKTHLVAMLVALAMPLAGQTGSLPRLASSPEQFVPPGWTLEKKHLADLNGDGLQDALLLMKAPQTGGTPPRILAVALRRKGSATEFELAEAEIGPRFHRFEKVARDECLCACTDIVNRTPIAEEPLGFFAQ